MPYDLNAFFDTATLPTPSSLIEAASQQGLRLDLAPVSKLEELRGFCPAEAEGRVAGFELRVARISADEIEDLREDLLRSGKNPEKDPYHRALVEYDYVLTVACRDEAEIRAGIRLMEILNRLGAFLYDPQTGRFTGRNGEHLEVG